MTQNATQAKKSRSFTVGVGFRLSSYYSLDPTQPKICSHSVMLLAGGQGAQNLQVQLTLFKSERVDYAHHITACPPRFRNLMASLSLVNAVYVQAFNTKNSFPNF